MCTIERFTLLKFEIRRCYCGGDSKGKGVKPSTVVTSGVTNCTIPCNGDPTQLCGGVGWLNFYVNTVTATAS